jgi:hypothetical protein
MMLRQAIVALGPKTLVPVALVGSALLGLGALFWPHSDPGVYRFTLHAPVMANAIYVSAWNDGDVFVSHDGSDAKTLTFTRRADEHDGCRWQGTEVLRPIGARAYVYSYDEQILSCEPDAHPFVRTPRRGIVTVEKADAMLALTPFDDVQSPGDLWADEDQLDDDTADVEDAMNDVDSADDEGGCNCASDDDADSDSDEDSSSNGHIITISLH